MCHIDKFKTDTDVLWRDYYYYNANIDVKNWK